MKKKSAAPFNWGDPEGESTTMFVARIHLRIMIHCRKLKTYSGIKLPGRERRMLSFDFSVRPRWSKSEIHGWKSHRNQDPTAFNFARGRSIPFSPITIVAPSRSN